MDKEKSNQILKTFKSDSFKVGNTNISFARQTEEDVNGIEKAETEDLINEWKNLVFMNNIYGQISVNELERITLIELEFESRKVDFEELNNWYEKTKEDFENEQEQNLKGE